MESLCFNVAQLLRDPVGSSRHVEVEADLRQLTPDLVTTGAEGAPEAVLTGPVRFMRTNAGILAQGDLYAEVTLMCARCLAPVSVPLDVPLEEVYSPTLDILTGKSIEPEEEDRALWIDAHHILDLTEVLRQNTLVSVPMQVLCKPDCQGLCPMCGNNLNEGPCECQPETDPRWDALTELLKKSNL